ncbi:MAG: PKD domain-containing protein [Muribaculaceae bacterium]|nr:PKD domain-containing protein [Muribaculaceae bacterium]
MKKLNKLALIGVSALAMGMVSCGDDVPTPEHFPNADVDFNYNVDGDQYILDYYVVSTIKFNNTSAKSGSIRWDFGDGETSTEPNPLHKYAKAGIYEVTLTIDGVGSKTSPILIYDIVPDLSVATQSTEIVEFNNTTLTFNLDLPNPENLKVKYVWTFPEGTVDENGNEVTTFTGYADENGNVEYPAPVKFKNLGSQKVEISTWFDIDGENRRLEDTYLNVQVGCDEPAPTLYYAQRGGNIKALKLVDLSKLPAGTKVFPYDMGVNAGSTVMNLVYADVDVQDEEGKPAKESWIYILDAGKQYYYINDENGVLGDGYINAMRTDGTGVNTVITNVGGAAFNDPFQGFATGGYLYYTDRNTGISRIALTARGEVQGKNSSNNRDNYFAQNNLIPYYGRGIAYGAIHVALLKDSKGVWWWPKNYSGNGIYRFKDTDIYTTQKDAETKPLPYPVIMNGIKLRSFTIDEKRKAMYLWRLGSKPGFAHYDLPGDTEAGLESNTVGFVDMDADPINTTADEGIYTCQLALDQESGRVYFCWRPTTTDTSNVPAGIVYYDPSTKKCVHYGDTNDLGMGICINPNKTKLF